MIRILFTVLVCALVFVSCNNTDSGVTTPKGQPEESSKTQLEVDRELIENYLTRNEIENSKAKAGITYVIKQKGNGEKIQDGSKVTFHAKGQLLDGTQFYSSYAEGHPLEIMIGQKMVISGMEAGLYQFSEGGKGSLFIPSSLGYGKEGFGDLIQPNAVLIFDIEIISVSNSQ